MPALLIERADGGHSSNVVVDERIQINLEYVSERDEVLDSGIRTAF
jgi:hypothetical protein